MGAVRSETGACVDCQASLAIVPVELALIISKGHRLRATSRVHEGVLGQEADGNAREVVFRSAKLIRQAVRTEDAFHRAHRGDVRGRVPSL